MANLSAFKIKAFSRHPSDNPGAYDNETHRYLPGYVNPKNYQLILSACDQLPKGEFVVPADEFGSQAKKITFPDIPSDVDRYEWTIQLVGGSFQTIISKKVFQVEETEFRDTGCDVKVDVPAVGTYKVFLKVFFKNGSFITNEKTFTLRDYVFVILGDSSASGQGNPDKNGSPSRIGDFQCEATTLSLLLEDKAGVHIEMDREPVWQEPLAYRSNKSGHSQALRSLQSLSTSGNGVLRTITALNFASSGAEVEAGLFKPQRRFQKEGQIAEAKKTIGNRKVKAVIVSIGVNDVGLTMTLEDLTKGNGVFGGLRVGKSRTDIFAEAEKKRQKLATDLDRLALKIKEQLNPRQVYITEYPVRLFDTENGVSAGCGVFNTLDSLSLTLDEARNIHEFGKKLNQTIREAAKRNNWFLIGGIEEGFATHGYCSDDTFFVGAEESCEKQGDFEGMVHPNQKGHAVYKKQIVSVVRKQSFNAITLLKEEGRLKMDDKNAPIII